MDQTKTLIIIFVITVTSPTHNSNTKIPVKTNKHHILWACHFCRVTINNKYYKPKMLTNLKINTTIVIFLGIRQRRNMISKLNECFILEKTIVLKFYCDIYCIKKMIFCIKFSLYLTQSSYQAADYLLQLVLLYVVSKINNFCVGIKLCL